MNAFENNQFDWVDYSCSCPECDTVIMIFKTWDHAKIHSTAGFASVSNKTYKISQVKNFQAQCMECGTKIVYSKSDKGFFKRSVAFHKVKDFYEGMDVDIL